MNTNTNIKQGYKQTSLGILPQEWEVVRLGEVGDIVGGGTPDTTNSAFWNGEIAWISSSDIDEESIYKISIRRFINEFAIKNSATNLIPAKSVLIISRVGVGKVAVNETPLCTSQDTQSLILKNAHYIFMAYLIKHNIKTLLQYNQGTSIQGFTKTELKSLQIPLPPLAEQEKIAQILGVWDKGISVLKSLIEVKTKLKKALMQRLLTPPCESLTPSLRASETSAAIYNKSVDCHDLTASNLAMTEKNSKAKQSLRFAEFTDKWQEMRLGDILEYEQPTKYLVKNTEYSNLYQTPVLTAGKTFILGKTNENFGVYKDLPIILFDDFMTTSKFVDFPFKVKSSASKILKPKTNNINLKIVFEMMQTIDFCAKDHKRYWISEYQNLTIKLPTLAEQKKIAQVLSACDKEIELLKSKFQCLKMQKKGLMQRLLNGEVRVKC